MSYNIEKIPKDKLDVLSSPTMFDTNYCKKIISEYYPQLRDLTKTKGLYCAIDTRGGGTFYANISIKIEIFDMYKRLICNFYIEALAGQCSTLVVSNTHVSPRFWNKGVYTLLQSLKEDITESLGFTYMMQTCKIDDDNVLKVIKASGSKPIFEGKNKRTNNKVLTFIKEL